MDAIAQDKRLHIGMITWLRFIIINRLEDEGSALLRRIMDEEEPSQDDNDNTVNANLDNGVQVQVENAAAEPQVDMQVKQPVEAEDPLPGGSRRRSREEDDEGGEMSSKRFRCCNELCDAVSDSDTDSDAEEEDPVSVPSSSPVPGGSRKGAREEDDQDDVRGSKQFRGKFADREFTVTYNNCNTSSPKRVSFKMVILYSDGSDIICNHFLVCI